MPDDFTITIGLTSTGIMELAVTGEVDMLTGPTLRDAINEAVAATNLAVVAVNLAAVTFIDSSGIHALIDADRALRALGGRLHLVEPSTVVEHVLELTGLSWFFAVDSALDSGTDADVDIEARIRGVMVQL